MDDIAYRCCGSGYDLRLLPRSDYFRFHRLEVGILRANFHLGAFVALHRLLEQQVYRPVPRLNERQECAVE